MRPLGGTIIKDATVNGISYKTQSTMSSLLEIWNQWEIQLMVLTSFVLQLFLFVTGSLRRRNIRAPLRVSIWLAYVGADLVAVYAIGLFSQYEEKYNLGRHSFRDTSPFLWVPFLLVHLGGQDSITAFSIEDNNLWLRHLLNLGIQGTLALYVFWKSIHRMNWQVLFPAPFIFVSGIIKYGERTWALRTGSRDGLGKSSLKEAPTAHGQIHAKDAVGRAMASYALQTVHLAQGLFVGRTMHQLGHEAKEKFEKYFKTDGVAAEEKVKIIEMELGMMFDLLYTKTMVLQRKTGRIFRCVAEVSMVVAFVLFVVQDHQDHKHSSSRVDTAITYTLFIGAILMEVCSVATVIASPWTWAHLDDTSSPFLGWLYCSKAFSPVMKAIVRCKNMRWLCLCQRPSSYFIGQDDHIGFLVSHAPTPRIICKVISALGLGNKYYQCYLKPVEAQGILNYVVEWFDSGIRSPVVEDEDRFISRRRLNYTLCLPFEHALYRLRVYTDLHISRHFDVLVPGRSTTSHAADVMELKEGCERLSYYMSYLNEVYPSMLPISSVVSSGEFSSQPQRSSRLSIAEEEAKGWFNPREPDSACPFEPVLAGTNDDDSDLKRSLEEIREMWMRLLVYAAGRCSGEQHARQLAKGGELLTFVWLLMLHHGLGDAATEVNLLASDVPGLPEPGSVVAAQGGFGPRPEQPRYAFDFRRRQRQMDLDSNSMSISMMQQIMALVNVTAPNASLMQGFLLGDDEDDDDDDDNDETEQDGAPEQNETRTSGGEGTPSSSFEIYTDEQVVVMDGAN